MGRKPELIVVGLDGALPDHILRMIRRGELPAFRRLMERGCWFSDCRPTFPTITPSCWASFSTGAPPAVHGIVCHQLHLPGTPLDRLVTGYHSSRVMAERFWESAARAGKNSLILHLPTSGPAKSGRVLQAGGAGCSAFDMSHSDRPTQDGNFEVPAQWIDSGEENARQLRWDGRFAVVPVDPRGSRSGIAPFEWHALVGDGEIRLAESRDILENGGGTRIGAGEWSPVLQRTVASREGERTFRCRARLVSAHGAEQRLKLFITEMGDAAAFASPPAFARELGEIPGIAANSGHHRFLRRIDRDVFLEAEAMNFQWQLDVMRRAMSARDLDIVVSYAVYIDSINHAYRNIIEGIEKVSEAEAREIAAFYDEAYRLADRFLAQIMEDAAPDATIAVLSDHGAVGYETCIDPHAALEAAGLLVYEPDARADGRPGAGTARRAVDWSRTRAWPVGSCHIFVNLKGRDPHGIVDPSDYDETVRRIIAALHQYTRDDARGISPVAFALRREEAGMVGWGGPYCGDVVYGIAESRIGGHVGGIHSVQIPTAVTETGSIKCLLLISGPKFRAGAVIDRPVQLTDIAPTLCCALRYPQPRQAEGAVIRQALRDS